MLLILLDWLLFIIFADFPELKLKLFVYESTELIMVNQNKPITLDEWSCIESPDQVNVNRACKGKISALKVLVLFNFFGRDRFHVFHEPY